MTENYSVIDPLNSVYNDYSAFYWARNVYKMKRMGKGGSERERERRLQIDLGCCVRQQRCQVLGLVWCGACVFAGGAGKKGRGLTV